jgi:hypothetical protein
MAFIDFEFLFKPVEELDTLLTGLSPRWSPPMGATPARRPGWVPGGDWDTRPPWSRSGSR